MSDRTASISRETAETAIELSLDLDGSGDCDIDTGIGFFDHMLEAFGTHGLFDIELSVDGDLEVDDHHTVEDVGITVGTAIDDALGEKAGIVRFADRRVPLDEAVASVVLDVSGRPHYAFDGEFSQATVGGLQSVMAAHFFRSLTATAGLTLHLEVLGANAHHEIEALFKGVGRALDDATRSEQRREDIPSSKGSLE